MRKNLAMLCAAMLFACCLALGACSGGGSSSAASSGSASASAGASSASASASASAQASFEGTWKLAAVESQGITMAGDFSSIIGSEQGMSLTIKADGTGEISMNDETAPLTWTQKDATTITIDAKNADGSASNASAEAGSASAEAGSDASEAAHGLTTDVTLKDGALYMDMTQDSFSGTAIFTADGTFAAAKEINSAAATPITSEDALVGSWTLSGMNMMGISMYGDAKDLAAMAGDSDMSLSFEKGGKCNLMGSEATYAVSADGAAITESGMGIPVKALGDDIAIDMTDLIGMEMIMVFSK